MDDNPAMQVAQQSHWYELNLRKGETHIELTADDPDFMAMQMRHWLDVLGLGIMAPSVQQPIHAPVNAPLTQQPSSVAEAPKAHSPVEEAPSAQAVVLPNEVVGSHLSQDINHQVAEVQPEAVPLADRKPVTETQQSELSSVVPAEKSATPEVPTVDEQEPVIESATLKTKITTQEVEVSETYEQLPEIADNDKQAVSASIDTEVDAQLADDEADSLNAALTVDEPAVQEASLADRQHPPEAGDDDFEKVMSTLMADLQVTDDDLDVVDDVLGRPDDMDESATVTRTDQIDLPGDTDDVGLPPSDLERAHQISDNEPELAGEVSEPAEVPFPRDSFEPVSQSVLDEPAIAAPPEQPLQADDHEKDEAPSVSDSFANICEATGAATSEDHLLISAYALTALGNIPRFSLLTLNNVIESAGQSPVNHSVLEIGLSKGLLVMVPDMTGTAEATEYELTDHGRATVETFL